MTWHATTDVIEAYLDDHLDAARSASLEQHLLACGDCRRAVGLRLPDRRARHPVGRPDRHRRPTSTVVGRAVPVPDRGARARGPPARRHPVPAALVVGRTGPHAEHRGDVVDRRGGHWQDAGHLPDRDPTAPAARHRRRLRPGPRPRLRDEPRHAIPLGAPVPLPVRGRACRLDRAQSGRVGVRTSRRMGRGSVAPARPCRHRLHPRPLDLDDTRTAPPPCRPASGSPP